MEQLADIFFVLVSVHIDQIGLHDILYEHMAFAEQKAFSCHNPDEPFLFDRIACINGLLINAYPLDLFQRLLHSHFFFQIHILHRHDAPGTVFRIV